MPSLERTYRALIEERLHEVSPNDELKLQLLSNDTIQKVLKLYNDSEIEIIKIGGKKAAKVKLINDMISILNGVRDDL